MRQQQPQGGPIINNGSISADAAATFDCLLPRSVHRRPREQPRRTAAYEIACGRIDIGNAGPTRKRSTSGSAQADGAVRTEPLMDVAEVGRAVPLHGKLAPRRKRRNNDLDGDEDAVHRPRLSI